MRNQRTKGQKLLTAPASEAFIKDLDQNLSAAGYSNRSQFIRDAILEKMQRAGVVLPKGLALAPSRLAAAAGGTSSKAQAAALKQVKNVARKILSRRAPGNNS